MTSETPKFSVDERIVILTGAGVSAESGVPTFRDAQTGLWEQYDPAQLATPDAWEDHPQRVWAWYMWRAQLVADAEPNPAHRAIADFAKQHPHVTVVTQNVDDLHERAGLGDVVHVHGNIREFRCSECDTPWHGELPHVDDNVSELEPPHCEVCDGLVRPAVVWFGETLPDDIWHGAVDATSLADTIVVAGTASVVYPAAALPELSVELGRRVIEVNPTETPLTPFATHSLRTTAAEALPELLQISDDATINLSDVNETSSADR